MFMIWIDELDEIQWPDGTNMKSSPRNYKHKHEVRLSNTLRSDELTIVTVQARYELAAAWLKKNLMKGQDWTYSHEHTLYRNGASEPNRKIYIPRAVWFNEKEHAIAFRFALGMDHD